MTDETTSRIPAAAPAALGRKFRGLSDRAVAWGFIAPSIFLLLAIISQRAFIRAENWANRGVRKVA